HLCSFSAPATPRIYTLSLHDALPIYREAQVVADQRADPPAAPVHGQAWRAGGIALVLARVAEQVALVVMLQAAVGRGEQQAVVQDRKSTRLNSSHVKISYAVFCLKKK